MKTKLISGVLFLFFILPSISGLAQNTGFSGEWKLNREKTILADSRLFLSKVTLNVKGDSLFTTRVYENENGEEYPFDENLRINGQECKLVIYNMPRATKATWADTDGSILIESKTTFSNDNGEDSLLAKEAWKINNDGKMLSVYFTNKMSAGEVSGTSYFDRAR
jgi:hypothetical protein